MAAVPSLPSVSLLAALAAGDSVRIVACAALGTGLFLLVRALLVSLAS